MALQSVRDKVVVVTGGAGPAGRALPGAFAGAGARVIVADRDPLAAKEVAVEVGGVAAEVDGRDLASVRSLADAVYAEHGDVDVLCNASVTSPDPQPLHRAAASSWRDSLDSDLGGAVNAIVTFLPRMRGRGGEHHLVNVVSVAAYAPAGRDGRLAMTHAALVAVTEVAKVDLSKTEAGVTLVCVDDDDSAALADVGRRAVAAVVNGTFLVTSEGARGRARSVRARHAAVRGAIS